MVTTPNFLIVGEYNYATPIIFTRSTLHEARAKVRALLSDEYCVYKRISIYEFEPLTTMPGTFHDIETVYPEKEKA